MLGALVEVELFIPGVRSLKAKRGVLKSLMAGLRNDLKVSVAEVDHHDLWQRASLGIAIAASSEVGARKVAQQIEKIINREPRVELITLHVEVVST